MFLQLRSMVYQLHLIKCLVGILVLSFSGVLSQSCNVSDCNSTELFTGGFQSHVTPLWGLVSSAHQGHHYRGFQALLRHFKLREVSVVYTDECFDFIYDIVHELQADGAMSTYQLTRFLNCDSFSHVTRDLTNNRRGLFICGSISILHYNCSALFSPSWQAYISVTIWLGQESEILMMENKIPAGSLTLFIPWKLGQNNISVSDDGVAIYAKSLKTDTLSQVGYWSPADQLQLSEHFWRVDDFDRKLLTVTTVNSGIKGKAVWHSTHFVRENETVWEGACIDIIEIMAEKLNFSIQYIVPPDKSWGIDMGNGSFTGMIGMVQRQEADIAVAKLTITEARQKVVDFTVPFYQEPAVMYMKKLPSFDWAVHLAPFMTEVWLAIVGSIVVVAFLFFVFAMTTDKMSGTNSVGKLFTLLCGLWFIFGSLLTQGMVSPPYYSLNNTTHLFFWKKVFSRDSIRVFAASIYMFVVILLATYCANLTAFLTVSKSKRPASTLEELANQNEFDYGVYEGTSLHEAIKTSNNPIMRKMWEKSVQYSDNRFTSASQIQDWLYARKYVAMSEKTYALQQVYSDCDLTTGDEDFFESSFAFAVQQGSPYKPYFDRLMQSLLDTGVIEHIIGKYYPVDQCDKRMTAIATTSVNLAHISWALTVMAGCACIATAVFILEHIYHRFVQNVINCSVN